MQTEPSSIEGFLSTVHPYDSLPRDELARVAGSFSRRHLIAGVEVYTFGDPLNGLFLVESGGVEILDRSGALVSLLGPRNSFGERGLLRDGRAATTARTTEDCHLLMLPAAIFRRLIADYPTFQRFFGRGRLTDARPVELTTRRVGELMARDPVTCHAGDTVRAVAEQMREAQVSSVGVTAEDGALIGLVTTRDLTNKVLAEGLPGDTPVSRIMTTGLVTLPPTALGGDVLNLMLERRIGHLPITEAGRLVGMITQTDITRFQALSASVLIRDIAGAGAVAELAEATRRIPQLLLQLVGGHQAHEATTRLVTDIADAVTRRLLAMAEDRLGPPPVPYLWLACGSQGRQEQTGVSDQDNCLMLDDAVTDDDMVYFASLAKFVSDGLNDCGYVYCPGDMMATNPRWCQPVAKWREYFRGWIARPDPEAQMLASVMFDLRPIGGAPKLFGDLQAETLSAAAKNSIFVAHMVSNSLKHTPPLGLLRGFATIRSGEHRNTIDMKHSGVVPVTDLGRIYALEGQIAAVNTRARLVAAVDSGVISSSGGRDLAAAYDLIAETRLAHQAAQIRLGQKPDNFLEPSELADFERSHLRDAFVVVRMMQSAIGHGKGALS